MKKKLVVIMTVLVTVVGLAFAETYSYWKVYACGHTEEATTSDQNKAGKYISVSGDCLACKYAKKRDDICSDPQSTQENRDTYSCDPWWKF